MDRTIKPSSSSSALPVQKESGARQAMQAAPRARLPSAAASPAADAARAERGAGANDVRPGRVDQPRTVAPASKAARTPGAGAAKKGFWIGVRALLQRRARSGDSDSITRLMAPRALLEQCLSEALQQAGFAMGDYAQRIFVVDENKRYVVLMMLNKHYPGEWALLPHLAEHVRRSVYARVGIEIVTIYWALPGGSSLAGDQPDAKGWRRRIEVARQAS